MAQAIIEGMRRVNRLLALVVGGLLTLCATAVLLDIGLRQVARSFGGTEEISGYAMAIATSWGMAYTLSELGHVRIDLIRARGGRRLRSFLDLFALAVLAATVTAIAVKCWPVVERSILNGSRANTTLETPLVLVQLPWMAGWVWFTLASWITLLGAFVMVLRGDHAGSDLAIGIVSEGDAETASAVEATR